MGEGGGGGLHDCLRLHRLLTTNTQQLEILVTTLSTRQKIANSAKQSFDLSVDGMQLTKVESECVLGVYIDSYLTCNEHIDTLHRKLLQKIAILARAWKYIPNQISIASLQCKYQTALYLLLYCLEQL